MRSPRGNGGCRNHPQDRSMTTCPSRTSQTTAAHLRAIPCSRGGCRALMEWTHRVMRLSPTRAGALRLLEVARFQRKGAWMLMCLPRPCALYVGEGPRRKTCLMGRRQRAALKALRRSARRCRRSCQSGPKPLFNGTKGSIPVRSSMSVVPLSYLPHFAFSLATRCRSCQRHQFPTCPSHW